MDRLIFLLEERSMQVLLEGLLPRLFPEMPFLCVPHQGKADLDRSISKTLRNWREPGARFVIVRDSDGGDCYALKERIRQLCRDGRRDDALVRIVCQELEAWYIGDPDAMVEAFEDERLRRIRNRPRYRNPDAISKPSEEIRKLAPGFQKIDGARRIAQYLTRDRNRSHSFAVFLAGVASLYSVAGRGPNQSNPV